MPFAPLHCSAEDDWEMALANSECLETLLAGMASRRVLWPDMVVWGGFFGGEQGRGLEIRGLGRCEKGIRT